MVREFVDRDVGHEGAEGDIAAFGPFIEQRTAEQPDGIGGHWHVHHRFHGQRHPIIEAGERERVALFHIAEDVIGWELDHAQGDSLCACTEGGRQGVDGGAGDLFDFVTGGGDVVHGDDMDNCGRL